MPDSIAPTKTRLTQIMLEKERINMSFPLAHRGVLRSLSPSATASVPGPVAVGFGPLLAADWTESLH